MSLNIETIKVHQHNRKKEEDFFTDFLAFLNKDISLTKGLKLKQKESFYSELSILISAGLDLKSSLEIIIDEQPKAALKTVYQVLLKKIIEGSSFWEALKASGKVSVFEYQSIKIGEESGKMADVLAELSSHFNRVIKQRRQITSALTYPTLVLITTLVAVVFMLKFIVPMFAEVFVRFQNELPPITQKIINLSDFFSEHALMVFLLIIGFVIGLRFLITAKRVKIILSKTLIKIPAIGKVIRKNYQAGFCQNMALLSAAKTPLLEAIGLIQQMVRFAPLKQKLSGVRSAIMAGMPLYEALNKTGLFDKRIITLTKVGEEVNRLESIYSTLSTQYTEELEHEIGIMNNLLEPVMILIVGILVGVILISMYLPMFQLSSSFM